MRAPIYSALGTLLHELLTGDHPFAEPSVGETISAILTRDPMAIPDPVPLELRARLLGNVWRRTKQSAINRHERLRTNLSGFGNGWKRCRRE